MPRASRARPRRADQRRRDRQQHLRRARTSCPIAPPPEPRSKHPATAQPLAPPPTREAADLRCQRYPSPAGQTPDFSTPRVVHAQRRGAERSAHLGWGERWEQGEEVVAGRAYPQTAQSADRAHRHQPPRRRRRRRRWPRRQRWSTHPAVGAAKRRRRQMRRICVFRAERCRTATNAAFTLSSVVLR